MILFKSQQKYLDSLRAAIQDSVEELQSNVGELEKTGTWQQKQIEELAQAVEKSTMAVKKQGMSLEDLVEMMEERQEQESQEVKRIAQLEEDQQALISIIGDYQETVWQLRTAASGQDVPWADQLVTAEEKIRDKMVSAGMDVIGREGEPVNYDLYDVITAEDTEEESLHGTVKQVFSPGCRFRGNVIKKSQVSAWRCLR